MKMSPYNTKSNSHFFVLVLVSTTYNLTNTDFASVKAFNNPQQQLKKTKEVLKLLQILDASLHVHNTKTNFFF